METKEYNEQDAKAYILNCFREQGDFAEITDEKTLGEMVAAVMAHDAALKFSYSSSPSAPPSTV